jgi:hypothetical protein
MLGKKAAAASPPRRDYTGHYSDYPPQLFFGLPTYPAAGPLHPVMVWGADYRQYARVISHTDQRRNLAALPCAPLHSPALPCALRSAPRNRSQSNLHPAKDRLAAPHLRVNYSAPGGSHPHTDPAGELGRSTQGWEMSGTSQHPCMFQDGLDTCGPIVLSVQLCLSTDI